LIPSAIDKVMSSFSSIRSRVDESLLASHIERIRRVWRSYAPRANPYMERARIAGIDSGYNYIEYRGYALYVVDVTWVVIDPDEGESWDGDADADILSSSGIETELAAYSIAMEVEALRRVLDQVDLVLVDGSLVAKFWTLMKAREQGLEIEALKGVSMKRVLDELCLTLSLYPSKVLFIAKNSNAKDVLGLVKGDVYYFERYTSGPGYSRPIPLTESCQRGMDGLARAFRRYCHNVSGMSLDIFVSYARFEPHTRVYRLEYVVEDEGDAEDRLRMLLNMASQAVVGGYPYPLYRADQLARVSDSDIERLAIVLGIASDPTARSGLWAWYP